MIQEIKKALEKNELVIGTNETLNLLRKNQIKKVFFTKNAPTDVKSDMKHFCELNDVECNELDMFNDELGVVCKKPFSISVVAIK